MTEGNGGRGAQEIWLKAAYESLISSGVDSVRIQLLAKRIGISRGSFYWAYKDHEALLADLLALWKVKNTESLQIKSKSYSESIQEGLLNIFDCWFDSDLFDSEFEFAVRSWALQSDNVRRAIAEADIERTNAIMDLFLRYGWDDQMAEVSAIALYQGQIGYLSMVGKEDIYIRMKKVPYYIKLFTGSVPSERELNRFHNRHNYSPPN